MKFEFRGAQKKSNHSMCLLSPRYDDSMERAGKIPMPKPPVPICDNMNKISEDMDVFRNTMMSVRRTTNEYLMLCLIGFGSIERRDALMRVIAWALEPILLYSAYIKDLSTEEFETVMITKKLVSATAVEEWLGLFNMSVCCIQFDSYMAPDMVTCISRIHHTGKHFFGSFKAKTSARVRRDFYKEHMKEMKAKEHQRLLEVTGLTLTTRNMLLLHDRVGTLQVQVARLERQLAERMESSSGNERNENVEAVEQGTHLNILRSRMADQHRQLARAYGQLNAVNARQMHVMSRDLSVEIPPPPPPTIDLTSLDESPPDVPQSQSNDAPPRGIAFIARPPPTGHVTVFVVRE